MESNTISAGIRTYCRHLCETIEKIDTDQLSQVVEVLYQAQQTGKKIFTMGNGGHCNTASHMINDLAKHTVSSDDKDAVVTNKRFRTLCLNDSMSFVTGLANDMGFDSIFSEQIINWCEPGDVVIGISGSGNSRNILKAFAEAKARGAITICLSGKGGGAAMNVADICVVVPGDKMVQIEDVHLIMNHAMADELKKIIQNRSHLSG